MVKPQYGRKSEENQIKWLRATESWSRASEENQIQWLSLSMAEKVKKIKFIGKASVWQKK